MAKKKQMSGMMKVIIAVAILLVITSYSGDTDKKTGFGCTSSSGVCTPNCNNEVNVCQGTTFADSCGNANACVGTKDCTTPTCEWVSNEPDNYLDFNQLDLENLKTPLSDSISVEYQIERDNVYIQEIFTNEGDIYKRGFFIIPQSIIANSDTICEGYQSSTLTYKTIHIVYSPQWDRYELCTEKYMLVVSSFKEPNLQPDIDIIGSNSDLLQNYIDEFYTYQCN